VAAIGVSGRVQRVLSPSDGSGVVDRDRSGFSAGAGDLQLPGVQIGRSPNTVRGYSSDLKAF